MPIPREAIVLDGSGAHALLVEVCCHDALDSAHVVEHQHACPRKICCEEGLCSLEHHDEGGAVVGRCQACAHGAVEAGKVPRGVKHERPHPSEDGPERRDGCRRAVLALRPVEEGCLEEVVPKDPPAACCRLVHQRSLRA